jgi:chromosome segregation ATPase
MTQLVGLLRDVMERQSLDVLLKRVELHYLALAPIQEDLRSARAERRSLEDEQARLQNISSELEDQSELGDAEMATSAAAKKAMRRDLEIQLKFLRGRMANAEQRIAELENDLTDGQRKIEIIEAMIDERMRSWGR